MVGLCLLSLFIAAARFIVYILLELPGVGTDVFALRHLQGWEVAAWALGSTQSLGRRLGMRVAHCFACCSRVLQHVMNGLAGCPNSVALLTQHSKSRTSI